MNDYDIVMECLPVIVAAFVVGIGTGVTLLAYLIDRFHNKRQKKRGY